MEIDMKLLSPMMKQYFEIKNTVSDAILLYRLGDFYEMFFDDAITGSRELELTLTGRDCGLPERAPMCGVPHHSVNSYIARLIAKGYRVAVCEQTEVPSLAKGIVRREVARVITPGTVTDGAMLLEGQNNYIACIYEKDTVFALCFADISTGVMYLSEGLYDPEEVIYELSRFSPTEVVLNEEAMNNPEIKKHLEDKCVCKDLLYDGYFDAQVAKSRIAERFDADIQKRLTALRLGLGVRCCGALLRYLEETQKSGVARIVEVNIYTSEQYMHLSRTTLYNLEIFETMRTREKRGSLLWVIDKTSTSMGRRLLRGRLEKPLLDRDEIENRLSGVEELHRDSALLAKTCETLSGIGDLERVFTKIVYKTALPRELLTLCESSRRLAELKVIASGYRSPCLSDCARRLDSIADVRELVDSAIEPEPPATQKDGGYIKRGFDPLCDELHEIISNSRGYLAGIEATLREQTGIKQLKIGYNRVFGYYIEVSNSNIGNVPDYFIRRQTLSTGERYVTEELKALEDKILGAREKLVARERQLYDELLSRLAGHLERAQRSARAVAEIDVAASLAETAIRYNYCKPTINERDCIEIIGGRHAVVERMQSTALFVPNNCRLDNKRNLVSIITGPNMAGKSTYMRQTALICLLAQIGSFVPARSADVCLVDSVFTRVGASDDLYAGQSTFMVEMSEIADILRNATCESLLILDEVGRGTSTFDGMSIAGAVLEYICERVKAKTLFATHFHELTDMQNRYDCIKNYNIAVKKRGDEISFLRRIVEGRADESYGIEVAKLAGVPSAVIERAKELLSELERKNASGELLPPIVRRESPSAEARLYEAVKGMSVESLTPIEAMYKLHELANIADSENDDD